MMSRKLLEDDSNNLIEMPDETRGKCNKCSKVAELGDGFCLRCWDRGSAKRKVYPDVRHKKGG